MDGNASGPASLGEWLARLEEATPVKKTSMPYLERTWSLENDAIVMTLATFALTIVLELASLDAVRNICNKKPGVTAYQQALLMNLVNNGILGPIAYDIVTSNGWISAPFGAFGRLAMIGGILVGHAIGYYLAHRWMHTRPMYWAHRFHHKFNTYVSPSTANAVSLAEYGIAYMFPFIVGSALLKPDRVSLFIAVGIISLNNLLIHTPRLGDLSTKVVPWWAVSTADHLEHHLRLTTHWAAPTISIDKLLACVVGKPESWGKEFKED